jgi:hypothetical protein
MGRTARTAAISRPKVAWRRNQAWSSNPGRRPQRQRVMRLTPRSRAMALAGRGERSEVSTSGNRRAKSRWGDYLAVKWSAKADLAADESELVRSAVSGGLGNFKNEAAANALLAALKDPCWDVRQNAIYGLVELEQRTAIPALLELVRNDESSDVRSTAASAIGHLGDEKALPTLEWVAENDNEGTSEDTEVRTAAILAIAVRCPLHNWRAARCSRRGWTDNCWCRFGRLNYAMGKSK